MVGTGRITAAMLTWLHAVTSGAGTSDAGSPGVSGTAGVGGVAGGFVGVAITDTPRECDGLGGRGGEKGAVTPRGFEVRGLWDALLVGAAGPPETDGLGASEGGCAVCVGAAVHVPGGLGEFLDADGDGGGGALDEAAEELRRVVTFLGGHGMLGDAPEELRRARVFLGGAGVLVHDVGGVLVGLVELLQEKAGHVERGQIEDVGVVSGELEGR